MRILFVSLAGVSHYLHLVPLAWAARAAGHEVRVAARAPVDLITGSGMPVVQVGGRYDFVAALAEAYRATVAELGRPPRPTDLEELPPEQVRRLRDLRMTPHVRVAEDMAADLVPYLRVWRPDVVVSIPHALVAPVVATVARVPLVRHLLGPEVSRHTGFPGLGQDPDLWPADLHELYGRYGVPIQADHAVCNIDPCPASLQVPTVPDRVPVRFTPYNGSAVVPGWLREPPTRPRVLVSWSMSNAPVVGGDGFVVSALLAGLAGFDVEIVAALPQQADRERLGPVPEGVRVVGHVPLDLVLPGCAAAIHHGGSGTLLNAAYYAVPQIIVPPVFDQMFNAKQLAATGAGLFVPTAEADTDAVKATAAQILADGGGPFRPAADRLREEILAQPSQSRLVRTLEELA
jgi:UDP:flavonoid glycosyltransferase YjiC (YdhE family)